LLGIQLGKLSPDRHHANQQEITMGTEQKVAVITGASQGIGDALVRAYRDQNYASSRSRARSSRHMTTAC